MKRTPYIVENQCGASDIPQSMEAKVVVPASTTRPTPERLRSRDARAGVGSLVLLPRPGGSSAKASRLQTAK